MNLTKSLVCIFILGVVTLGCLLLASLFGPLWQSHPARVLAAEAAPLAVVTDRGTGAAEATLPAETPPEEDAVPGLPLENLLFLGDSMIANPETVSGTFSARGHQVLAGHGATIPQFFGVTEHDVTVGVEGMGLMTGGLRGRDFGGIVVLLGANDIAFQSPEQVLESYKTLLTELNEFTDAPVAVLAVFPTGEAYGPSYGEAASVRNSRSSELNRLLSDYCDATLGLYFADAAADFTGRDGLLTRDVGDGLHISLEDYELFCDSIESALRRTGVYE